MTYHHQVLDYLTDTYGVDDAEIIHRGGSHPKLTFTYAAKRFSAILQRDEADNPTLFNMKRQDLRRLLGTPPDGDEIEPPKQKRSLDQMTQEAEQEAERWMKAGVPMPVPIMPAQQPLPFPAPPVPDSKLNPAVVMGHMCRYKDRLKFQVPEKIAAVMKRQACSIERLSADSWKIVQFPAEANRKRPKIRLHLNQWEMEVSRPTSLYEDLQTFGPSPAEYLLVDDRELMVRLLTDQLKLLMRSRRRQVEPPIAAPSAPEARHEIVDRTGVDPGEVTFDQMHAALAEIRRIERLSLYRLVKLLNKDGGPMTGGPTERWVFRAPLIE